MTSVMMSVMTSAKVYHLQEPHQVNIAKVINTVKVQEQHQLYLANSNFPNHKIVIKF